MNTTFDASYRTRTARSFLKAYDVKSSQNPDPSFIKKMAQISGQQAAQGGDAVRISSKDMSMEEYQEYIYGRISQLPMHPSNMQDTVAVQISQAGLEAMKNDPEYEKWVLDSIQSGFSARDPWSGMCGGKYTVLYFGDTQEQSRGESWRAGFMNGSGNKLFQEKAKNSFWERRAQRHRELQEQFDEIVELKELNKDLDKGLYYGELAILAAFRPKPVQSGMPQE